MPVAAGSIRPMPGHADLLSELNTSHAARTRSVRALRGAQAEYVAVGRGRKQAARTVLKLSPNTRGSRAVRWHTQDELATALGVRRRELSKMAADADPNGVYTFRVADPLNDDGAVLAELRDLAKRYDRARRDRRELVLSLRQAPAAERLTFEEMGAAMGLSSEGVRYLTRK